jgi:hypothetical protein
LRAVGIKAKAMKDKKELRSIIERIESDKSPVGMDALYVHAVIIDKLVAIEKRLLQIEESLKADGSETVH